MSNDAPRNNIFFSFEFSSSLEELCSELSSKDFAKAVVTSLRPAAKVVMRGIKEELAASHPRAVKYKDELSAYFWKKGAGVTVALSGKTVEFVSKKGKVVKGNHLHILKWLSAGTAERRTSRGAYRGKIAGSRFFKRGVEKTTDAALQLARGQIAKNIRKAVERVSRRRARFERTGLL